MFTGAVGSGLLVSTVRYGIFIGDDRVRGKKFGGNQRKHSWFYDREFADSMHIPGPKTPLPFRVIVIRNPLRGSTCTRA